MSELLDMIKTRRSIRKYKSDMVPKEIIDKIVEAGTYAATGIGSCWIHRAKEEFESEEGKELLKSLGIKGDYVGIGHCVLGYVDGEYPQIPERKSNWAYYID